MAYEQIALPVHEQSPRARRRKSGPEPSIAFGLVEIDIPERREEGEAGPRALPYREEIVDGCLVPRVLQAARVGEQLLERGKDPASRQPTGEHAHLGSQPPH